MELTPYLRLGKLVNRAFCEKNEQWNYAGINAAGTIRSGGAFTALVAAVSARYLVSNKDQRNKIISLLNEYNHLGIYSGFEGATINDMSIKLANLLNELEVPSLND